MLVVKVARPLYAFACAPDIPCPSPGSECFTYKWVQLCL